MNNTTNTIIIWREIEVVRKTYWNQFPKPFGRRLQRKHGGKQGSRRQRKGHQNQPLDVTAGSHQNQQGACDSRLPFIAPTGLYAN